jgi:hypothetical protein
LLVNPTGPMVRESQEWMLSIGTPARPESKPPISETAGA